MGIKGLTKLIKKEAPTAVRAVDMGNYFGKVVAIDASIIMYQFLTSARENTSALSNLIGDETSHISGILYRTIKLLENGIKPVFVFDGEPPVEKQGELKRRADASAKVKVEIEKAKENGDTKLVETLSKRVVKISDAHVKNCQKLLDLLGVPYLTAYGDAEAQCAVLVIKNIAYAVATEDMDALTFGTNILIRHFSAPKQKAKEMEEYSLLKMYDELRINQDQFIDLCILLGCDFCETIKGVGPGTALKLIRKHKSIEKILESIDRKKYTIPDNFVFAAARKLFKTPMCIDDTSLKLKWSDPDIEGLSKYLITENNFNELRVKNSIDRLIATKKISKQSRLDVFFNVKRKEPLQTVNPAKSKKINDKTNLKK